MPQVDEARREHVGVAGSMLMSMIAESPARGCRKSAVWSTQFGLEAHEGSLSKPQRDRRSAHLEDVEVCFASMGAQSSSVQAAPLAGSMDDAP